MGKTPSFVSQCGTMMKMTCCLIKKTHAVMGLDTLSDNIIKAKSTDDDEELFDANKFLELMNTLTLTWV